MVQFNLLPKVKVDYVKTKRLKRLIVLVSFIFVAVSAGILALTFSYSALQKKHVNDLNKDIAKLTSEINNTPELKTILSVQNQLNTLQQLYAGRPAVKRLPAYLDQTTPSGTVSLTRVMLDLSLTKIEFSGKAQSLEAVNRYADTLKFTTFTVDGNTSQVSPAFTDVVLQNFGRDDASATFSIILKFNPLIFDETKKIDLIIPTIVTTRSQVNEPTIDLFNGLVPATEGQN